jgi:hypothetical protein
VGSASSRSSSVGTPVAVAVDLRGVTGPVPIGVDPVVEQIEGSARAVLAGVAVGVPADVRIEAIRIRVVAHPVVIQVGVRVVGAVVGAVGVRDRERRAALRHVDRVVDPIAVGVDPAAVEATLAIVDAPGLDDVRKPVVVGVEVEPIDAVLAVGVGVGRGGR